MTDKPILFSPAMVRALLDGRKTMTRRVLKPQPCEVDEHGRWYRIPSGGQSLNCHPMRHTVGDRLIPAREIPSLPDDYCADINGHVWSRLSGDWQRMSGSRHSRGYLTITPANGHGSYPTKSIHRLVCEAWHGPAPTELPMVRHLDGDQRNNAPENLDWGTQKQNRGDRSALGRGEGEDHHCAKLTCADVEVIRTSNLSQRALARKFGTSQSTIWSAKAGKSWADDHQPPPPNMPRWASRLTLIVTAVSVQRIQDISEADAKAEGLAGRTKDGKLVKYGIPDRDGDPGTDNLGWPWHEWEADPRAAFRKLWDSINAARGFGWDTNPWVSVTAFDVIKGNIDQVKP